MHIGFAAVDFHGGSSGGGIASYVSSLGSALVNRGHRVTVIAKGLRRETRVTEGMQVVHTPLGNLHWYLHKVHAPSLAVLPVRELEWSYGLRRVVADIMQSEPLDVLESYETGVLFLSGAHGHLPPLVVRLHGDQYTFAKHSGDALSAGLRLDHRLQVAAWKHAAALTTPSHFHAAEIAWDLRLPSTDIEVIPNPVSEWMLQQAREHVVVRRNCHRPPTVLYTGRIEHRKGSIPLLHSVPQTLEHVPDIRYVVAGARHASISEKELTAILSEPNISGHVELRGHVPWQDLPGLYGSSDVFVMPSYYETFGISVAEAMAFGLPVVATTAGALPEVVEDGVTGLLVPPGDPQALSEAIVSLVKDAARAIRMGAAGRERVLAEFTVDRVADMTLAVYDRVAGRSPTSVCHRRAGD